MRHCRQEQRKEVNIMDKLIEILEDIQPDIDYNTCRAGG